MPTVARLGAYRFFFFSNEGHEPPHIHVEAGERYAKFWLEPISLEKSVGFNAAELSRVRKVIIEHRARFQERWDEHFGR